MDATCSGPKTTVGCTKSKSQALLCVLVLVLFGKAHLFLMQSRALSEQRWAQHHLLRFQQDEENLGTGTGLSADLPPERVEDF